MKKNIYKFLLILIFFFVVLILNSNTSFAFEFNGQEIPEFFSNDYQYYVYIFDGSRLICNCSNDSPFFVDNYYSFGAPVLSKNPKINAFLYRWTGTEWVFYRESAGNWNHFGNLEEYPILHSSYTVLDHRGNEYFVPSNSSNNSPEELSENFSKFALPSRDVLYDYTIITAYTNASNGLISYSLITSTEPIAITDPACSSCQQIALDTGFDNLITYCVDIPSKHKVFAFNPNYAGDLYALHSQKDDKTSFDFDGLTYYNGWAFMYKEDTGFHSYELGGSTIIYNSLDSSLNNFDNVIEHFVSNFNQNDLDMELLDMYSQIGTWHNYIAEPERISETYRYEFIYKSDDIYYYLSTNQPITLTTNGCSNCSTICSSASRCAYPGEPITYCIDVQNGDQYIFCSYDPTSFPTVSNYDDVSTDLWTKIDKSNNSSFFGRHFHEANNFQIIYSNYNITSSNGNVFFEKNDLMDYRRDVVNNYGDYTFYIDYEQHFADEEDDKDHWLVRILKAVFIPSQERIDGISNAVKDKFRFIDSITSGVDELKTIFSDLQGAPTLTLYGVDSKYFQGNLTYLDLSWYEPFKPYGDLIITGFIYIFYLLRLFAHIPNIIHGVADYGDVRSDGNNLVRTERDGTVYYFRRK